MHEDMLAHMGSCIRNARNKCGLTQQELAEQTGKGYRHLQDIEKGHVNPSYEVLAALIKRLAISPNNLFYPDADAQEQDIQHFLGNFQYSIRSEIGVWGCMFCASARRNFDGDAVASSRNFNDAMVQNR